MKRGYCMKKTLRTAVAVGILTAVVGSGTAFATVKTVAAAPVKVPVSAQVDAGADTYVEEDC
jgi:hypothetical protein